MSPSPITSAPPPSSYAPTATPLSRDGVAIAVIDSALDTSKIPTNRVLSGTVRNVARDNTAHIDTDAGPITARVPDRVTITPGQSVRIELPPSPDDQKTSTLPNTISVKTATLSEPIFDKPQNAPRTADIYTPSSRVPSTPSQSTPIDVLAKSAPPPPLTPGAVVAARSISLPDAVRVLMSQPPGGAPQISTLPVLNLSSTTSVAPFVAGSIVSPPLSLLTPPSFDTISFLFQTPPTTTAPEKSFFQTIAVTLPIHGSPTNTSFISPGQHDPQNLPANMSLIINDIKPFGSATLSPMSMTTTDPTAIPSALMTPTSSYLKTATSSTFWVLSSTREHATIIGTSSIDGNTAPSFFSVQTRGNTWPVGTVFTAHPLPHMSGQIPNPLSSPGAIFAPLDDIMIALSELNITAPLPMRVPIPSLSNPQNFGASLFLFLAAMRSGDLAGFLGDNTVQILKRSGRGDRLEKLDGLFRALKSALSPSSHDWKTFMIPVQTDGHILPLMVHIKSPYDHSDDQKNTDPENHKNGQRVVINMTLDHMGDVQMDMRIDQTQRMDTILRTELALSRAMQDTITRLYAGAMEKTRLTGDLFFQNDPKKWVTVTPDDIQNIQISA